MKDSEMEKIVVHLLEESIFMSGEKVTTGERIEAEKVCIEERMNAGKAPLFWMKNGRKGGVSDERKKGHGAVCGAFDDWADDMREYGEGRDFYGGV